MQALNLGPKQPSATQRPASEFPEPADVYLCDKCARNVTAHLNLSRAHVRQPLGSVKYVCRCGQCYRSGATEWDYLNNWNKRQWLMDIPLVLILFAGLAGYGVVAYLAVLHRSLLMIVLSLIGIPVAIVFLRLFIAMSTIPFQIAGSLLRTRLLGKE
jgi:hypothetical protein